MTINAIDFGQLYRDHMAAAGGREKPPSAWDARAAEMNKTAGASLYTHEFTRRMNLDGCETLLDMGCGTGAIGLALAPQLKQVVGVDYSAGMLEVFTENARTAGAQNVGAIQCAWEDDWADLPVCDLVVASRSTTVMDIADALQKLDSKARRRVYLTNLVGGSFIDPGLLEAIGRKTCLIPDYIYILNILHQMGRHPRLDYIEARGRLAGTKSFEDFLAKVVVSLGELTDLEQARLSDWYYADLDRAERGGEGFKWAFVSWETQR
jgi:SAM-dependent methyltransferase